jgi:hypothetical protein
MCSSKSSKNRPLKRKGKNREYCGNTRLESRNHGILERSLRTARRIAGKKIEAKARGYAVVNGELYKSGVKEPWLRCITIEKGLELLKEIHSGFCGAHIGTRALEGKTIKQGFYWPTINIDAITLVWECEAC